jgi:hypothetical protein
MAHPQMELDRCEDLALVWGESQHKARRIAQRTLTTAGAESSAVQTTILNNDSSGVYAIVATAGDGALVAAWTQVAADSQHSSIALGRLESVRTCSRQRTTTNDAVFDPDAVARTNVRRGVCAENELIKLDAIGRK